MSPGRASVGVVLLWAALATWFVLHTADHDYSHDFVAHLEYSRILAEGRLPSPLDSRETFQPPLYYLLASLLAPSTPQHARWVRLASVVAGAIALALTALLLARLGIGAAAAALVLAAIATTPKFLFVFATYNNDALATVLAIAVGLLAWSLWRRWRWRDALLLVLVATAGLYTKATVGFAMVATGAVAVGALLRTGWGRAGRRALLLLGAMGLAVLFFAPWLVLHNYARSAQLLPVPCERMPEALRLPHGALRTIFTPPGVTAGEWHDPYAHPLGSPENKKSSFLAYLFVTSVVGEFPLGDRRAHAVWILLLLHVLLAAWVLPHALASPTAVVATAAIAGTLLALAVYLIRCPVAACMDFRLVAWTWLPWTALCAEALRVASPLARRGMMATLAATIVVHLYVVASLVRPV
jgi:hypothetical protein